MTCPRAPSWHRSACRAQPQRGGAGDALGGGGARPGARPDHCQRAHANVSCPSCLSTARPACRVSPPTNATTRASPPRRPILRPTRCAADRAPAWWCSTTARPRLCRLCQSRRRPGPPSVAPHRLGGRCPRRALYDGYTGLAYYVSPDQRATRLVRPHPAPDLRGAARRARPAAARRARQCHTPPRSCPTCTTCAPTAPAAFKFRVSASATAPPPVPLPPWHAHLRTRARSPPAARSRAHRDPARPRAGAHYSVTFDYALLAVGLASYTGVDVAFRVWTADGALDNVTTVTNRTATDDGVAHRRRRPSWPAPPCSMSFARVRPPRTTCSHASSRCRSAPPLWPVGERARPGVPAPPPVDPLALRCVRDRTLGTARSCSRRGHAQLPDLADCGLAFTKPALSTGSTSVFPVYRVNGTDLLLLRSVAATMAWNFSTDRDPLGTWLLPTYCCAPTLPAASTRLRRGGPAVIGPRPPATDTGYSIGYDDTRQGAVLLFRAARRGPRG